MYNPTKGHILDWFCCSGITPFNSPSADLLRSEYKAVLFNTSRALSKSRVHRTIPCSHIRHVNPEDLLWFPQTLFLFLLQLPHTTTINIFYIFHTWYCSPSEHTGCLSAYTAPRYLNDTPGGFRLVPREALERNVLWSYFPLAKSTCYADIISICEGNTNFNL